MTESGSGAPTGRGQLYIILPAPHYIPAKRGSCYKAGKVGPAPGPGSPNPSLVMAPINYDFSVIRESQAAKPIYMYHLISSRWCEEEEPKPAQAFLGFILGEGRMLPPTTRSKVPEEPQ